MNQLLEDLVQSKTRERGQPSKGSTSKLKQRQSSHSVSQEEIHDKGNNSDLSAENSPKNSLECYSADEVATQSPHKQVLKSPEESLASLLSNESHHRHASLL